MTKQSSTITEVDIAIARLYLRRQEHPAISNGELNRKEKCDECHKYDHITLSIRFYHTRDRARKTSHWATKTHITQAFNIPLSRLNKAIAIARVMEALE